MKICSINANRFGGKINYKYNQSTYKEKCEWYENTVYRKVRAVEIAKYIMKKNYDVVLLQEVDYLECFDAFSSYLIKMGYQVKIPKGIGVVPNIFFTNMIVAKQDVNIRYLSNCYTDITARWQEIQFCYNNKDIYMLNLHSDDSRFAKPIEQYIKDKENALSIVMGDFNAASDTDRMKPFNTEESIRKSNTNFLSMFDDNYFVVSDRKMTYYNNDDVTDGRRLDHCYVSKSMNPFFQCTGYTEEEVNVVLYPDTGLTDHSPIILEIKTKDISGNMK